jgi:PIN domain nuclease of toxin-antitoxin system
VALLLDTHAFLWWVADDRRLSPRARRAITRETSFLSLASCWEMAIKISLKKLIIPDPPDRFIRDQLELNGFRLLPVSFEHALAVAGLPFHHRDPFDRLLAVQALDDELSLVSAGPVFEAYGVARIW